MYTGVIVLIAIAISALFAYLYYLINKRKKIFAKYHLYALIINIVSLYIFSKMLEDVVQNESIVNLDVLINQKIVLMWNPLLTKIMVFITSIANLTTLLVLSILLLIFLLYKNKIYSSRLLIFSMLSGLAAELLIKAILHRVRPENNLISFGYSLFGGSYSFPSGHATMATIFFSLLLYSFKDDIKNALVRNIFIIFNVVLFLTIGFSRIYLNVHWFSDVIAGYALGLFWITFYILAFRFLASAYRKIKPYLGREKDFGLTERK